MKKQGYQVCHFLALLRKTKTEFDYINIFTYNKLLIAKKTRKVEKILVALLSLISV